MRFSLSCTCGCMMHGSATAQDVAAIKRLFAQFHQGEGHQLQPPRMTRHHPRPTSRKRAMLSPS